MSVNKASRLELSLNCVKIRVVILALKEEFIRMYVLDGQWYMEGLDWDDEGCIHSSDELLSVIESVGFLPLFSNSVQGFSVEEMTDTSCWWCGDADVDP